MPTTWQSSRVHQRPSSSFSYETSRHLNVALLSAKTHVKIICRAAGLFLPPCQIISALAAQLVKSVFLPSHSYVMCEHPKALCPFPLSALLLALFSSECFSKRSLAQVCISRTPKTEGREPESSGENGSSRRWRATQRQNKPKYQWFI